MFSFNFPVHSAYKVGNSQIKDPFELKSQVCCGYVELTISDWYSDNGNKWIIVDGYSFTALFA
ncbi:MAG: hypothetical protein IPM77_01045 [Crocinitomicaceae bacterium]|nr:hypothetical protein [Crocinitomicaceae bacterium]